MKKLFNIGSSIVLHASSALRITGPYELKALHLQYATLETDEYVVELSGKEIVVEKLAEELVELSFEEVERIEITQKNHKEIVDGSPKI